MDKPVFKVLENVGPQRSNMSCHNLHQVCKQALLKSQMEEPGIGKQFLLGKAGWMGIWRYASIRSMETVQVPGGMDL